MSIARPWTSQIGQEQPFAISAPWTFERLLRSEIGHTAGSTIHPARSSPATELVANHAGSRVSILPESSQAPTDRGRMLIAMDAVRPALVVELAPAFDDHLGLGAAAEPLAIQQLVAQLAVEALDEAVLPRTAPVQ